MQRVAILTTDQDFIARRGVGTSGERIVIEVPTAKRVRFCGHDWYQADLGSDVPRDYPNGNIMALCDWSSE